MHNYNYAIIVGLPRLPSAAMVMQGNVTFNPIEVCLLVLYGSEYNSSQMVHFPLFTGRL